jgi:hypothetical protein
MSESSGHVPRLLKRRDAVAAGLPAFAEIVRGSLVTRYRRCGKPTCHCATTRGHGPAHYLVVTLKRGKTEQILLSKAMLPVARQFLANYARWWAALEQVSAVNRRLLRLRVAAVAGQAKSSSPTSD